MLIITVMTDVLGVIGDGLGNALQMAWEVWWASTPTW
jgi:hypothetical protein